MKFNEDGSGFTLENEDEWNRFKKMAMIALRSKIKQQSMAQPVFDTPKDDEVKVKVDIDDYFANHDFAMLYEIIDGLQNRHRARAQVVFDALKDHEVQVYSNDPSDSTSLPASKWGEKLDEAITNNLDTSSIFEFVEILMEDKERTMQTVRAHKRHAENRTMKTEVFQWLDENMTAFKSMDAAAQGIAGKTTPITFRTARDWVGEWKKLRSTGTP